MNRYFEAYGLMNVESYTQISEHSSGDLRVGVDTNLASFHSLPTHHDLHLLLLVQVSFYSIGSGDE